jgi:flagellar biosynthesis protein FlhF
MQVKKFEAKTMKEALELVKVHMGPEAIILSAKDSHRGFGLMGEKSVEVTAAVSEETLRKKKIAESKLREDLRIRFQQIPATKQREFINKVFDDRREEKREFAMAGGGGGTRGGMDTYPAAKISAESRAATSGLRYADIPEEDSVPRAVAQDRVRRAAERARLASQILQEAAPSPKPGRRSSRGSAAAAAAAAAAASAGIAVPKSAKAAPAHTAPAANVPNAELEKLESQVRELKTLVERFQHMPQVPMSMHPGAEQGLPFELSPVYQRLTQQGIQVPIVSTMLKKAQKEIEFESLKRPALVEAWIVRQLLNSVEVSQNPTKGRYHVFLGSTGQGKTTSLFKFASHLVLKEKKTIAIISLDTIKVGAADQLKIYAQILNVPFAIVRSQEEWRVAESKLRHVQHILVDCPGFNLRSMEEVDWLKAMLPPTEFDRTLHYVQSALARDEEALDLAGRYQMLGFHDLIFTRCDESSRHGLLLNFQEHFKKPLHSFGMGPRIPEDYEFATKERVIDFIFKLSKISKKEAAT